MTTITKEQMASYRATARRREQARKEKFALRHKRAWQVAREAAGLLKEQFGAKQVGLFGSVLEPEFFDQRSDVDLAVWGLNEKDYYRAVARLLDIEPSISVDLVEVEFASPRLRATIEKEGVIL